MGSPQAILSLPTASWPTLPTFPHPASLFAGPGNPFVVGEASSATAALDKVKDDLRSGAYDLGLPPPTSSSLTPLPPIPVPPVSSTRKRSSIAITDGASKPLPKPPLPKSLKTEVSLEKALQVWEANLSVPGSVSTTVNSRGDAILFELGPGFSSGAIWALLKMMRDDGTREPGSDIRAMRIAQVKLFSPADCTKGPPLVHTESQDANYRSWSLHLSSLSLSMPDLLYRLPHITELVASPCFYCSKRLVSPDGLPSNSGFLPYANKKARKSKRGEKKGAESAKEEPKDVDAEKEGEKEDETGRWVCWHPSCEP